MSNDNKPAKVEVFYDEFERKAVDYFEKYKKDKTPPELLLQASEFIAKSVNPEANQISILYKGLYLRDKGMQEKEDSKARKYLLKALTEFKKVIPKNDRILKSVELEFLKRKLKQDLKSPDLKILLRTANLRKELGQETEYNKEMSMYYMFFVMDNYDSLTRDEVLKNTELMLTHAKNGLNEELYFKVKGLYHQIRANSLFNPKEKLVELRNAVDAIEKTSDKYGEATVKTELIMTEAMTTSDRKKRNILLESVAEDYKKRGLKKREDFVRNLTYPVPLKTAKAVYLCDQSIEKLRTIEKKLVGLRTPGKPAAVFYHIGYLMERIKDVKRIMIRMGLTRKEITENHIKMNSIPQKTDSSGKYLSKRLQKLNSRNSELTEQMRQDMESLFIYGNLLLDQWSYIISYLAGYEVPSSKGESTKEKPDLNFAGLLNLLQAIEYHGELKEFWNTHKKDVIWLNFHLREYRNIFVEHMRKPWQRGTTMGVYGDDFNFHIPSPVGYVDEKEKKRILEEIYPLAPQRLKNMPDDYWEKKNLHRVLEVTLYYIDELDKQSDRDKVWSAWHKLGGSAPSYDTVGIRLLNFLFTSLETMSHFIDQHPKLIKFGDFVKNQ